MKTLYSLLVPVLLVGCNQEESDTSTVLSLHATSQRSNKSAILSTVGGQVLQIDKGKCKLSFNLIEDGKVKRIDDAIFDSKLGKVAYITPAIGAEGMSYIDLYVPGLEVTVTENTYSQKPSMGGFSYEFKTPASFGTMIQYKRLQLEQATQIFAYSIMHDERVPLSIGEEESIESMVDSSKKKDLSFLVIMAEPIE